MGALKPLSEFPRTAATAHMLSLDFAAPRIAAPAWSLAQLGLHDLPLSSALSAAARPKIRDCRPETMCCLAWAGAVRSFADGPLLEAISSSSIRPISEFVEQEISNTAWSLSVLAEPNAPLL